MNAESLPAPVRPTFGHQLKLAFRPGWQSLKAVWRPFLLCQLAAVGVVVLYFAVPAVAQTCAQLGEWKRAGGIWFAGIATAIAGVVLPELAQALSGDRRRPDLGDLIFRLGFFAVNGIIVSYFYQFQGFLFGHSNAWQVIVKKMLFDQLVFTTFVMVPFVAMVFTWQAGHFRWAPLREELRNGFLFRKVVPVLLPNWAFWIPMVLCIYSLPSDLQYVFFCFVFAAWSLLLVRLLRW